MYYRFEWAQVGQRVIVTCLYDGLVETVTQEIPNKFIQVQRSHCYLGIITKRAEGKIHIFLECPLEAFSLSPFLSGIHKVEEVVLSSRDCIELYSEQPTIEELLTHTNSSVRIAAALALQVGRRV